MAADADKMTLAAFRATFNVGPAQWCALARAGAAPAITVLGRTKFITAESARAWQEAQGERVVAALSAAAQAANFEQVDRGTAE